MQQNSFDKNQLIGFGLLLVLFLGYYFLILQPEQEKELALAEQQQVEETAQEAEPATATPLASSTPTATNAETVTLENDKIEVQLSALGAQPSSVELKEYKAYNSITNDDDLPLYLINNQNSHFSLKVNGGDGTIVDLSKRVFTTQQNGNSVVFTTEVGNAKIQYTYTLKEGYNLALDIQSSGITGNAQFAMDMNSISQEKGKSWEKRMTEFYYSLNNLSDVDYTSSSFNADSDETVDWVAFKQQFFSTILEKENGFKEVALNVEDTKEEGYSKLFNFSSNINNNGNLNEHFNWYFVPLDHALLSTFNKDFQDIIPFGWGIFGWINEWIILPVFKFMATWGLKYGWVIALLTIFIKLITSPIMYKQYKQSAMMRVLKPEMEELNEKYKGKDNALKKQQETMKLYRSAGVNPLAGCLPALLQIPIFYALFNFFPNIIDLRGKNFLWAEDLTAYDSIMELPFSIPFYGDHISLFAILYVVTMMIYFKFSGNMMNTPQQEGMPDMRKLMYIMPIFFLFFLNSYASGLSWYYFISNAINIGLVLFIKNVLINDEKIHAKIQANKLRPKKKRKNKWAAKLDEAMQKAQEQQKLKNK